MRPLIQPWHTAVVHVAPPDLEELYLCVALSCFAGVPLYTAADIRLDESIVIFESNNKAIQQLGFDVEEFAKYHGQGMRLKHVRIKGSCNVNFLIPAGHPPWGGEPIYPTVRRLDKGEYLWVIQKKTHHNPCGKFSIKGFLQPNAARRATVAFGHHTSSAS
jgi:hypothetical protein